ncbi:MAG: VWA domain-containing protein [Myxococcota bacterium]
MRRYGLSVVLAASLGCAVASEDSAPSVGESGFAPGPGFDNGSGAGQGTNVGFGGAQDFGFFRSQVESGAVPRAEDMDAAGFFAEHYGELPGADCGERVCLQAMLGVMNNLVDGNNCTLLQIGLNSPLVVDPESRSGLDLAVVVDVSGSMASEGKLRSVQDGLRLMVNEMRDTDRIAIVTYNGNASTVFALDAMVGNRNRLLSLVDDLRADGATNIFDGLRRGYQELRQDFDTEREARVLLLSDGEATAGETGTAEILAMSAAENREGIGLTTIGVGTSFNIDLMRDLALQSDGNFYFVEDASAVDEVFTEELAYFTVPVARSVEIDVEVGALYDFGRALGSPLWEDRTDGGQLTLPSVFLAHRESADDVTDGGDRRGGGSRLLIEVMPNGNADGDEASAQVARVTMSYTDPVSGERSVQERSVVFPSSPLDTPTRGLFETPMVEKSFVVLNLYVGLVDAVAAFHSGAPEEALDVLVGLVAAARDYEDSANEGEGDRDIRADVALMETLIGNIENLSAASAPADVPEDPWPAD